MKQAVAVKLRPVFVCLFDKNNFRQIFRQKICQGNLTEKKKKPRSSQKWLNYAVFRLFYQHFVWSEWRESNSRPLEPHSSALPNCATPGHCRPFRRQKLLYVILALLSTSFFHFHGMIFSCRPAVPVSDCFCIGRNRTG